MEVLQYKCPNCGAGMSFNAGNQSFDCEYCLSSFSQKQLDDALKISEKNSDAADNYRNEDNGFEASTKEFEDNVLLYNCPSCGAEIMADNTTAATFCYYCHNPVILTGRLEGKYKPSKLIPFKYTREMMLIEYEKWCKKRWFIQKEFASQAQEEKISGIYIPYWVADCNIDAYVSAVGKNVKVWRSGDYQYTKTDTYDVQRNAYFVFDNLPADGSSKANDSLMESIEPYNYGELKNFSMSYLSGYLAEKYDIDNAQVLPRIKQRVEFSSDLMIKNTLNYNQVSYTSKNYNLSKINWDYVLLPVWFMTYKYKDKNYYFAMNGQSGKVSGLPPLSVKKVILASIAILAASGIIGTLLGFLI